MFKLFHGLLVVAESLQFPVALSLSQQAKKNIQQIYSANLMLIYLLTWQHKDKPLCGLW